MILTTYFQSLGASEHFYGQLIYKFTIPFEDTNTVYSTSIAISRIVLWAFVLTGAFSFCFYGTISFLKLFQTLLIIWGILNVWTLNVKEVRVSKSMKFGF